MDGYREKLDQAAENYYRANGRYPQFLLVSDDMWDEMIEAAKDSDIWPDNYRESDFLYFRRKFVVFRASRGVPIDLVAEETE